MAKEKQPEFGVEPEKARKMEAEIQEHRAEVEREAQASAPRSAAPGSHPLRPIEDDPDALAAYQNPYAAEEDQRKIVYHRTSYGNVVGVLE